MKDEVVLAKKKEFVGFIENVLEEYQLSAEATPEILNPSYIDFKKMAQNALKQVKESELLVPLVGGFSAGKSTAINALLGEEILPVAVTAETAIPAEIRFAEEDYIIAIKTQENGAEESRHLVSELSTLSQSASEYEVVKIYLNRPILRDILPFTLVDMPGFESSNSAHNYSILRYITKGAFYFFLVNMKDGSLKKQDFIRLSEIYDLGRDFTVFLTKKDLSSAEEIEAITKFVKEQVESEYGSHIDVRSVDSDDNDQFLNALKQANPEELFYRLNINLVKDVFYHAASDLNTALSGLKTDAQTIEKELSDLEESVINITLSRDQQIESIKSGTLIEVENRVVAKVESQLQSSVQDLANSLGASSESFNKMISDLVRGVLVSELNREIGRMSNDVVNRFSGSMNFNFKDVQLEKDWANTLIDSLQSQIMSALVSINSDGKNNSKIGTGIGAMLGGLAMAIPHPVIKVVMMVLPGIIGAIFDNVRASKEKEQKINAIQSQVIPSVISSVRAEVSNVLVEVSNILVKTVSDEFERKLHDKKVILDRAKGEHYENVAQLEQAKSTLEGSLKNINSLAEKIIA
ncbi:MAG: dynamin family protein [Methyloprofundus sp.]|nr:dynamin family protein [Methyloprofundus sp.]